MVEKLNPSPGTGPIKILRSKFYATLFFKYFDWMLKNSANQNA